MNEIRIQGAGLGRLKVTMARTHGQAEVYSEVNGPALTALLLGAKLWVRLRRTTVALAGVTTCGHGVATGLSWHYQPQGAERCHCGLGDQEAKP